MPACRTSIDKDRSAIEALVADDFHFTSPLDNGLDRAAESGYGREGSIHGLESYVHIKYVCPGQL